MLIDRVAKSIEMALPNYCIVEKDYTGYTILSAACSWPIAYSYMLEDFTYIALACLPSSLNTHNGIVFDTLQIKLVEFLQDNYILHRLPKRNGRNDVYLITEKVYGDS